MVEILKKTIAFFYSFVAMALAAPHIWDGSADVSWYEDGAQTYNLTTPEQLAGLAKLVNNGTSDFSGKTISLGANIFLNDTVGAGIETWYENAHRNWVPIGTINHPFKGEFDGLAGKNNHKIYGLYIKSTSYHVGLFGYTSVAKISNIDILIGNISSEDDDVGTCVGYALMGSITNVHAEGIKVRGVDYVGGLTGDFSGKIKNSSFVGNVTGRNNIGGIAGRAVRPISKCYSSGIIDGEGNYVGGIAGSAAGIDSVYHTDGIVRGQRYVGGLVGNSSGSVLNSYSKGNILGTGEYVGGLAGYVNGNVSNSHSEGNVAGLGNYVGGLVGLLYISYSNSQSVSWDIARDSYSIGNVKGENYVGGLIGLDSVYRNARNDYALTRKINGVSVMGTIEGKNYVGGIVGKMSYGYSDSSFSSNFYSEIDSCHHANGEVVGVGYVGGLLGYTYGSISNSYSEGNVKGLSNYVGGLIGYGTDVQKSYVEGSVESDSSYVGGITGYASGTIDSSSHIGGPVKGFGFVGGLTGSAKTILNSFSEGNVFGRGDYVGGLVGFVEGIQKSYVKGAVESDSSYVGGLAGYVTGTNDSNYHIGGNVRGFSYVGGLLGYATNGVFNSHSEGNVTGLGNYVGGLLGYVASDVFNSHSEGNVTGLGNYVGGLIGLHYCLYEGFEPQTWRIAPNSYSVGNVKGGDYVGGLIGLDSVYRNVQNTYTLTRYFNGVSMRGSVEGNSYVGGIVGKMNFGYRYSSASSDSYYKSEIDSCHHTDGDVAGLNYIGGLAGYIKGPVLNSSFEGNVNGLGNYVGGLVGVGTDIRKSYVKGSVESDSSYVGGVAGKATGVDSAYHIGGDVGGFRYVGGLAGSTTSDVLNSYSEGNVKGKGNYVGGLVGVGTDIRKSYVKGSVESDSSYVGGVAGRATGVDSAYHIEGDVSGFRYVGGLAGSTTSDVLNSYSEGNVKGKGNYVGGLVGYGKIIKKSHAKGSVIGQNNYVGGITGYSTGTIDEVQQIDGNVSGLSYVGGLVGYTTANLSNSIAAGSVTGVGDYVGGLIGLYYSRHASSSAQTWNVVSNSTYTGSVKGANYVGGLVGLDSVYRDVDNKVVLTRNFKSVHMQGSVEGLSYVGGIVGKMNYGYKYDSDSLSSYYKSEIDSCYHIDGDVIGTNYVGGLSGSIYGFLSNSYSEGNVRGDGNYVGGLVGYGKYKIRKSYVDGYVVGNSDYVGGLVGYMGGQVNHTDYGVDSSYHIGGNVSGRDYIGGLVGYASSNVYKSRSEGDVRGTGKYVGGLVGFGENEMRVRSCDAVGSVSSDSSYVGGLIGYTTGTIYLSSHIGGSVSGHDYVGGLTGCLMSDVSNSNSEGDVVATGNYVGGLVGYMAGDVSDSHSEGNVSAIGNYVGGLVGMYYRECKSTNQSIWNIASNSHSSGNVKGGNYVGGLIGLDSIYFSSNQTYYSGTLTRKVNNAVLQGSVEGKKYVGGIVGKMNYGYRNSSFSSPSYYKSELNSCEHTHGDVVGLSYVGGLVGYTYGSISDSHSDGNVVGDSNYIGGLAGAIAGRLVFSYHTGEKVIGRDFVGGVAGSANVIRNSYAIMPFVMGRNNVGGLSGYATDSVYASYFEGDTVMGTFEVGGLVGKTLSAVVRSYSTTNVKGDDNVGGLVGSADWHISDSYALGNVVGDIDHSSTGNDNLGGLVGYQYAGSISNSMALGNVSGTTKLGGLVGRFDGKSISKSYANGDVTGDYYGNPADEMGNYYIGGLVGYAKGTFTETYASGAVRGIKEDPVYTGCIVGYVNGSLSITNSYYDKTKCDLGADGGENAASISGVVGKTTAEMYNQSTFENWDFVDTWKMMSQSYPFLQIYANSLVNAVVTTESLDGFVYDGLPKTPQVTMVSLFGGILTQGVDYSVNYVNNSESGSANISVCGHYPYGGCKNIPFEIAPLVIEPSIATIENVVYTGYPLTPKVSVNNGENILAITDYTVEYKDNINAGKAMAFVHLKGNYSGSGSQTFTIEKATPVINQMPMASDIPAGQQLGSSELLGGAANVEGVFIWETPQMTPLSENDGYVVAFVPIDTVDYNSVEFVVPLIVRDAASVVVRVNGAVLDSMVVIKGGSYTLPVLPDSIGYSFVGFYNGDLKVGDSGDEIIVNENTVVEAVYEIKTFVVRFVNNDMELQSEELSYGTLPTYKGSEPVKMATAQYTYIFKGWDPAISSVAEPAIYMAVFDSVVNKYEVLFKDYDGSILKDAVQYDYGTSSASIVKPINPTRQETAKYTYTFKRWNPTLADVTGNTVYTAEYDSTIRDYQVVFVNGNEELQSETVAYGEIPTYNGVEPSKPETAQHAYIFKDWAPVITPVTGNVTYTAVYDSIINKYDVMFMDYKGMVLSHSTYAYGTDASQIAKPDNPKRDTTAKYIYTFKGWTPSVTSVTDNATYTAVFDSTLRKYSVSFVSDGSVLETVDVVYGETPKYSGETPTKPSSKSYSYEFAGWSPKLGPVEKDLIYTAVFDSTVITGIADVHFANQGLSVKAVNRNIQISTATIGSAYVIFDMQGRVLRKGRVDSVNFNIVMPIAGNYLVKIGNQLRHISVK
ncbi:GLUG motif-containing protein [Fibrobacter sp. UWR2]|uniref:GLUG motif-containing protein n=1 Tax=Fibrobacter sp. UWR2 TaxID=1964352 RepID=UPI00130301C8|nr:GLUG motif-containing protein [Fibrobacter sp. UWR2]